MWERWFFDKSIRICQAKIEKEIQNAKEKIKKDYFTDAYNQLSEPDQKKIDYRNKRSVQYTKLRIGY